MSGPAKSGKQGVSRKRQNGASGLSNMDEEKTQSDGSTLRTNGSKTTAACEASSSQEGIGERLAKRPRSNRTVTVDYEDVSSSSEMSDNDEEAAEEQNEEEEEVEEPDDFEDDEGSVVSSLGQPEVKPMTIVTRRTSSRLQKEAASLKIGSEAPSTAPSSLRMEKKLDSERKRRANNEEGLQQLRQTLPKQYARLTKADLLVTAAERLKEHENWKNRARYFEGELMAFIAAEAAKQRHQPIPHHPQPHHYQHPHPHQPHYQHRQAGPPYPYYPHNYGSSGQPMPPFLPPAQEHSRGTASSTSSRPAMPPTPDSSGMPIRIKHEEDFFLIIFLL